MKMFSLFPLGSHEEHCKCQKTGVWSAPQLYKYLFPAHRSHCLPVCTREDYETWMEIPAKSVSVLYQTQTTSAPRHFRIWLRLVTKNRANSWIQIVADKINSAEETAGRILKAISAFCLPILFKKCALLSLKQALAWFSVWLLSFRLHNSKSQSSADYGSGNTIQKQNTFPAE